MSKTNEKPMREYFATLKTMDDRHITFVWESKHRRGTWDNYWDLAKHFIENDNVPKIDGRAYERKARDRKGRSYYKTTVYDEIYLMNEKNKYDQCYGDYEIIDLR